MTAWKSMVFLLSLSLLISCGKDKGNNISTSQGNISNAGNYKSVAISGTMTQLRDYYATQELLYNLQVKDIYIEHQCEGDINFSESFSRVSYKCSSSNYLKISATAANELKYKAGQDPWYLDSMPEKTYVKSEQSRLALVLKRNQGEIIRLYVSKMYVKGQVRDVQIVEKRANSKILSRHILSKDMSYFLNPLCSFNAETDKALSVSAYDGSTNCDASTFNSMHYLSSEDDSSSSTAQN